MVELTPEQIPLLASLPAGERAELVASLQMITVPRGGRLLLCTDGVTDAVDAADQQFGQQRLLAATQQIPVRSAQSLCDHIQATLLAFRGDAVQFDDITLVVVQSETA